MVVTDRRQGERRQMKPISQHFRCPSCPFEGDEAAMIDHAQIQGHVAVPADLFDDVSRMDDEGCPNG